MRSSTSILLTLAIAIVILQSIEVSIATRLPSSSEDGLLTFHHVYVANGLSDGKVLLVHCQSKDDDLGIHTLAVGSKFKWQFKLEVQVGETLFWCYLAPDNAHHLSFEAFNGGHYTQYEFHTNTNWIAKDDGVYVYLDDKKTDSLVYEWQDGRPDII